MVQEFADRAGAGRSLAKRVKALPLADPVVLALPRGGVPVAAEVALALRAPLDLVWVQKITAPGQPEVAVAAVVGGEHPDVVADDAALLRSGLSHDYVVRQAAGELREIERRRELYLRGRESLSVAGKTVVLVDDGLATGITASAAIKALRHAGVAHLVLAVPVAAPAALAQLRGSVDAVVCLLIPPDFQAIGAHYVDFHAVSDAAVVAQLNRVRDSTPFAATD